MPGQTHLLDALVPSLACNSHAHGLVHLAMADNHADNLLMGLHLLPLLLLGYRQDLGVYVLQVLIG